VTEELIVQLMPILGMELNRPWTTKSVLQEIARAEMSDLYEREISSLKSQIDDLNDRIIEKDLMIDNLSPKIKTSWLGSKT
jgi:predicted RNase H-like nuclease (RuvC/YqgF family)